MMPRKKRRIILILSIVMSVILLIVGLILLYKNTDMFKSNVTLFAKYLGQNVENIEDISHKIGTSKLQTFLQENKYTTNTQVKVNYVENIGTSSENTQNSINQLKLKINGQTDSKNQYNYQNFKLLSNEETIANVEYIQNGNTYGIKFSDLFNQYVLVDNENLKELFKKMGYTQEQIDNIPNKIEFYKEWRDIFDLSEEEKQNSKTKYLNIINSNISAENFSKQKDQMIQINGKKLKTNAYVLTMTKEQLNNIYIKILEEAKQDEMILTRVDKIQTLFERYLLIEDTNLREEFIKGIEELISNITKNNIGSEETKITVYENNRTTVSTMVQTPDYEVYIDLLDYEEEEYIQFSYKDLATEQEQIITYKRNNQETSLVYQNKEGENVTEYSFAMKGEVDGNSSGMKNIVAKYEDNKNRVQAIVDQEINIVTDFEEPVTLDEENSINLSKLEEEQVKEVMNRVNKGVSEKIEKVTSTNFKKEDFWKVLKVVGFVKKGQTLESMGITETEKSRFNSKFEILQGEELENEDILKLIEAVKDNLIGLEVVSNTQLKLKLDRLNKNEEVVTTLTNFIKQQKDRKYSAKVEYDETTGLVSDVLVTIVEQR